MWLRLIAVIMVLIPSCSHTLSIVQTCQGEKHPQNPCRMITDRGCPDQVL